MMSGRITDAYDFTTITLNVSGEIIGRSKHQARLFVEKLDRGPELELVAIPGGAFRMGSFGGKGYEDERPQHRVTVAPFFIGKYPITQEQWQFVMGSNPSRFKGPKHPVESISWKDACRFCERLSKRTGRAYRLPSEAELEYACRAGTTTPFHFGETVTTDAANYNGEFVYSAEPKGIYRHTTTEVGAFPPNAFGLFDMHGNVWEWSADVWHDNYEGGPSDNRAWKFKGDTTFRVARGGCWHDTPDVCRSAARLKYAANEGDEFVGFRAVMA